MLIKITLICADDDDKSLYLQKQMLQLKALHIIDLPVPGSQ